MYYDHVCPNCGYCPCCGRPRYGYPYYPYQQPYIWCGTTSGGTSFQYSNTAPLSFGEGGGLQNDASSSTTTQGYPGQNRISE